jgi:hypothetical protein
MKTLLLLAFLAPFAGANTMGAFVWSSAPYVQDNTNRTTAFDSGDSEIIDYDCVSDVCPIDFTVMQTYDVTEAGEFQIALSENLDASALPCDPNYCNPTPEMSVGFTSNIASVEWDQPQTIYPVIGTEIEQAFTNSETETEELGVGDYSIVANFMGQMLGLDGSFSGQFIVTMTPVDPPDPPGDPAPEPAWDALWAAGIMGLVAGARWKWRK